MQGHAGMRLHCRDADKQKAGIPSFLRCCTFHIHLLAFLFPELDENIHINVISVCLIQTHCTVALGRVYISSAQIPGAWKN